jgi:enoyl-CoA hydratase
MVSTGGEVRRTLAVMTDAPQSEFYETEIAAGVATVWLNRPNRLNAMNEPAWAELPPIMGAFSADDGVRVVVIAARGRAFTAGIDLVEMGPLIADPDAGSTVERRRRFLRKVKQLQRTFSSLADCPKPVIAAVHGPCIGGGLDLISACDIRLASADAVFSLRETRLAMVADVGTMQRLPRIIGPGMVAELAYTGRDFTAEEALAMGLVNRVLEDRDALIAATDEMAHRIAANSPLAVQGAKAVLRASEGRSVADGLEYVALWNTAFIHSEDIAEAVAAHLEGRDPEFEGK